MQRRRRVRAGEARVDVAPRPGSAAVFAATCGTRPDPVVGPAAVVQKALRRMPGGGEQRHGRYATRAGRSGCSSNGESGSVGDWLARGLRSVDRSPAGAGTRRRTNLLQSAALGVRGKVRDELAGCTPAPGVLATPSWCAAHRGSARPPNCGSTMARRPRSTLRIRVAIARSHSATACRRPHCWRAASDVGRVALTATRLGGHRVQWAGGRPANRRTT